MPLTAASRQLYAPLVRNGYYGSTGISVVNPMTTTAQVTVTYVTSPSARCTPATVTEGPREVAARASTVFYQPAGPMPPGCSGSAEIEATQPIVAMVNDVDDEHGTAAAYAAVSRDEATRVVAIPLVRNGYPEWMALVTGVQVMNVGPEATTVTIIFYDREDNGYREIARGDSVRLEPRQAHAWYVPSVSGLPKGWFGSAVVESTNQKVVAIINEASRTHEMDSAAYNAIGILDRPWDALQADSEFAVVLPPQR